MVNPVCREIDRKKNCETVTIILYRNGYRVELARSRNKKNYEYCVQCELRENPEFQRIALDLNGA